MSRIISMVILEIRCGGWSFQGIYNHKSPFCVRRNLDIMGKRFDSTVQSSIELEKWDVIREKLKNDNEG